jgi:hypothetical protein
MTPFAGAQSTPERAPMRRFDQAESADLAERTNWGG